MLIPVERSAKLVASLAQTSSRQQRLCSQRTANWRAYDPLRRAVHSIADRSLAVNARVGASNSRGLPCRIFRCSHQR